MTASEAPQETDCGSRKVSRVSKEDPEPPRSLSSAKTSLSCPPLFSGISADPEILASMCLEVWIKKQTSLPGQAFHLFVMAKPPRLIFPSHKTFSPRFSSSPRLHLFLLLIQTTSSFSGSPGQASDFTVLTLPHQLLLLVKILLLSLSHHLILRLIYCYPAPSSAYLIA